MKKTKRSMSPEARQAISEAMKVRWQKARAVKHAPPNAQSITSTVSLPVVYVFRGQTRGLFIGVDGVPEAIDVKFVD